MSDFKEKSKKIPRKNLPVKVASSSKSIAPLEPLQLYMMEVGRYPLLTLEEEQELVNRYRVQGDLDAAKRLVTANLRLVIKIVMDYKRAYTHMLDLIQEGNIGLMKAVQKYDPEKGTRFSYYASWWIRAYIIKYIIDNFRLVKIGTTHAQQKLFFNLMKEKRKMEALGFAPTETELSKRLQLPEKDIREMDQRLSQNELSLDMPVGDSDSKAFLDFLSDEAQSSEDQVTQKQLKETLLEYLDSFTQTLHNARDIEIFKERLLAEVPTTLQEIADRYGITRERVRQLETNIMKRLKKYFQDKHFSPKTNSTN